MSDIDDEFALDDEEYRGDSSSVKKVSGKTGRGKGGRGSKGSGRPSNSRVRGRKGRQGTLRSS